MQTEYQKEWIKPGGGWTAIIAPGGSILAGPLKGEEGILYAEVDMGMIADMAHWHDATGHYSRPDVTNLLLNRDPYQITRELSSAPKVGTTFGQPPLDQVMDRLKRLEQKVFNSGSEEFEKSLTEFQREIAPIISGQK